MNAVDTDNSVAPAPNLMSLSDLTPTMHPHFSNLNYMLINLPKIPTIPQHTKKYMLSNTPLSNAKFCDTDDPTKPSSPPIQICPEKGSLIILYASSNDTTDHPLKFHKGQRFPSLE